MFTGGPGTGKSRVTEAVGRVYQSLGVLSSGHLTEVAGLDLAGKDSQDTGTLVREAAGRACGGLLLITDVHVCAAGLEARDQQGLRHLQEVMPELRDDLVVILAGPRARTRALLRASPAVAARFPAVIDFPPYSAGRWPA